MPILRLKKGPAKAPSLIREALRSDSSNSYSEDLVNINDLDIIECGDFEIQEYFDIEKITRENLEKGDKILTLGGDHSITFPVIKAVHEHFGDFDILQIDAHSDLYDDFEGNPYSHACPFARIMENSLAKRLVQVGVRTLTPHQKEQADRFGVEIHTMKDLNLEALPNFERPLYISIDMDGFDPAFAPGVSHIEPGGLTSRQVLDLLHKIDVPIIGADIVEYNPDQDVNGMTAFLAAKLLKELMVKISRSEV